MENDKDKQRRKNLLVGWTIGILAVVFYAASIFYK
jgi:hypothetical protein